MTFQEPSEYDNHPYPTKAQSQLHIDNLFAIATLQGFSPPAVGTASVLEIGCGDGMNLIPMACGLPAARFVGVDYAAGPIARAQAAAVRLGLGNIRFHHADVCDMASDFGEFDYIIAHGFYSWVPDAARNAMWAVAAGSLTERGLLFVSHNLLPGWRQTEMLRDFSMLAGRHSNNPPEARTHMWDAIARLASLRETKHPLAIEAARTIAKGPETAFHDELNPHTRAFHFREVANAAANAGFRFVGDAKPRFRGGLHHAPEMISLAKPANGEGSELIEEYQDVLSLRPFRQSIFTRNRQLPDQRPLAERAAGLWVRGNLRLTDRSSSGMRIYRSIDGDDLVETDNPALEALTLRVLASAPDFVPFTTLTHDALSAIPGDERESREEFWTLFELLLRFGAFYLGARPFTAPPAAELQESYLPRVRPLVRMEAAIGPAVTSRLHETVAVPDPLFRALLVMADGTRSVKQIAAALAVAVSLQKFSGKPHAKVAGVDLPLLSSEILKRQPELLSSDEAIRSFTAALVPQALEQLRRLCLLEHADVCS